MKEAEQTVLKKKKIEENIEQFVEYRNFIEKELLPMHDDLIEKIKEIVKNINKQIASGTITQEEIKQATVSLRGEFRKSIELVEQSTYKDPKYGPVVAILGGMLRHSLANFSSSTCGILELMQLKLENKETISQISEYGLEKNINDERFTKDYLLKFPEKIVGHSADQKHELNEDGTRGYNSLDKAILAEFSKIKYHMPESFTKNVQLEVDIPKTLVDDFLPYERIVYEIVKELIRNSIYAFNGKNGQIKISLSKNNKNFVLTISDTGPGISAGIADKIFTKGLTTRKEGTGMGLYFVKEAIEKIMSGNIKLISTPGAGVKISMEIPYS